MQLNIEQRLNLVVLLGALECRNLADTRSVWKLMDKIELTDEEKLAIDYAIHRMNGSEAFTWNNQKSSEPVDYDFSDGELKNLRRAIDSCPRWTPAQARRWLEPLLQQMPEPGELPVEPVAVGGVYGGPNPPGVIRRSEAEIREQIAKNGG